MIGLSEIRAWAMALPEVTEGPPVRAARRIAAFKVAGKSFLGLETGGRHLTLSLGEAEGRAIAAEQPDCYEEIRRGAKFMGLRLDLAKAPPSRVPQLIERSWRASAPKAVVAAYDAANRG